MKNKAQWRFLKPTGYTPCELQTSSRPWRVYHQNEVLYITNTKCCIDARRLAIPSLRSLHQVAENTREGVMICTFGDEIQTKV